MAVDAGYVAYLKAAALYTAAASPNAAQWPQGLETEILSPIASRVDAVTEGGVQAAILAGPNARDKITIGGARKDLIGKCVTAKFDRLGYAGAGAPVFVLGAQELDNGTTILTVLKRLP